MNLRIVYFFIFFVFFSCRNYGNVLKNNNVLIEYESAKKYFADQKYSRATLILEKIAPFMKTTLYGEEMLYMLAQSCYKQKKYILASKYFENHYTLFPNGAYSGLARFYSAYSLYLNASDIRLDQSDTYKAISQLQFFLECYPESEKKVLAKLTLFKLNEKLAMKELLSVRLYYNLGNYFLYSQGENYLSCLITAQNALQLYDSSFYRENFRYYIFRSKYEIAKRSKNKEKKFRYEDVSNEYYSYIQDYPTGKYYKEIKKLYFFLMKNYIKTKLIEHEL